MRESLGEKVFNAVNVVFMILLVITMLYPFIYVFSASISEPSAVTSGKVWLLPMGFELGAYSKIFQMENLWTAYGNTVYYSVFGTVVALFVTVCGAYALSKERLVGRKFFTGMVLVTLWFNAGMMPFYLNIRDLGLLDMRITLIIAFACSAFYVVVMRTYFESIPESLEESAKLDGANDITILFRIYLPLSLPALATIGLYYFVERWNSYFWAMNIFSDVKKVPLQVLIKKLIVELNLTGEMEQTLDVSNYTDETIIYGTIVVAVLPMIVLYPFVQKFFIRGMMVGSVKG